MISCFEYKKMEINDFLFQHRKSIFDKPTFISMIKKLTKGDKKIFGVCSGLANYFDIDPTIVRVIFLVALFVFGTGILLYVILAIAMPDK